MTTHMVTVPPTGAVEELVVDRRTGASWTTRVEPFALAETVVTRGLWGDVHGVDGDPGTSDLPKTEVSWREAIVICNRLSRWEGLNPVYELVQREVALPAQW